MPNKIRIAPTPSGYLHLGNILSFALTAALAERVDARILLRIDDMDRQRANSAYVQDIFDTLNFLEIPWHEGPRTLQEFESEWSQIHRMPLYQQALEQLLQTEQVFACNCSRSQIRSLSIDESYPGTCSHEAVPLDGSEVNWRITTPRYSEIQIQLWPQGNQSAKLPALMQYFVVRKKDGFPAYQLSSLVDDVHFGITHIVRGVDLLPSTLAQVYLAQILRADSFTQVQFYHHGLLMGADQQKLSKSAGATSIRYLREQGYKPEQIYQQIANLTGIDELVTNWRQLAEVVFHKRI
ncbi:glutamate--tRNA ligase family protein [Mucilaginibacter lacusdianchii]|uniref:glutamate--tRNA ligase family protein n=1 Tax=Mucilaginibacter lacusdianchii TaxID=2684211 RepID=UPI00131D7614|nr:glutamate--tRNA ligase family protein [Mucilaginibacter sp. JXJ CY 39]